MPRQMTEERLRTLTREERQALPRYRTAVLEDFNEEERTCGLSFASEEPCLDWWGDVEILRCNDTAMNISRFNADVMPLLFNHKRGDILGKPLNIWTEAGKAYAKVKFAQNEDIDKVFNLVRDGFLKGVSVGYRVNKWEYIRENETTLDGITGPAYIAIDWEVFEISIVSVPADSTVGVGRSMPFYFMPEDNAGSEEKKGERQMANEEKNETKVTASEPVNIEAEREAAVTAERERVSQISALCQEHEVDDEQRQAWINDGADINKVNRELVGILAKRNKPQKTTNIKFDDSNETALRSLYAHGLLMREGYAPEKCVEGAEKYRNMGMKGIARDLLLRKGDHDVMRLNDDELFQRAMTTTMLPTLLAEVTRATLAQGFASAEPTWQEWAYEGSLKDFRPNYTVSIGLEDEPIKIPENGEFTDAKLKESKNFVRLDTYGRSFSYTRQAFINDDQAALTEMPFQLAQKMAIVINRMAYQALAGGTYTANVNAGTPAAITSASLGEAMKMLRLMKDPMGKHVLRIMPKTLLVPVALATQAEQLITSMADPSAAHSGVTNVFKNKLRVVSDPELDAISPDAWYLLGNALKGQGVEVDFLNGNKTPILEHQTSFDVLGWKYRTYLDFGVKLLSTTNIVKNAGKA